MRSVRVDLVEEIVPLSGRELVIVRPRESEALLDEEAFEHEEFLPYWAEVWPSGLALGRSLERRSLRGARVVELGCGLGIPSIVAALNGGRVLATDWSPDAVRFAAENAARNGVRIETAVCSWSQPDRLLAGSPWDLVLASDVLYERRNVDLLLGLLPRVVAGGEILLADPGRPHAATFLELAANEWDVSTSGKIHRLRRRRPTS